MPFTHTTTVIDAKEIRPSIVEIGRGIFFCFLINSLMTVIRSFNTTQNFIFQVYLRPLGGQNSILQPYFA